jgi:hypothetical protein
MLGSDRQAWAPGNNKADVRASVILRISSVVFLAIALAAPYTNSLKWLLTVYMEEETLGYRAIFSWKRDFIYQQGSVEHAAIWSLFHCSIESSAKHYYFSVALSRILHI